MTTPAYGRTDWRGSAPDKFGKVGLSFPDNSTLHPTFIEVFDHRKDSTRGTIPYLTLALHPRAQGCYCTEQTPSKGDDDSSNWKVRYDRLPGLIKTDYPIEETYRIETKVQTQIVIAQDNPVWRGARYSAEFTLTAIPTANETVIVGSVTYKFVAALTGAANEVLISTTIAATLFNLSSAINLDWGIGVNFGTGTTQNTNATSWFALTTLAVADANTPTSPVAISTTCANGSWATAPILVTTAVLKFTSAPANGDTVSVGSKTYTYQTALTNADGNVLIGANASASLTNLANAINLAGGGNYAAATTANPSATATGLTLSTLMATANANAEPTPIAISSAVISFTVTNTTMPMFIEIKQLDANRMYRIASRVMLPLPIDLTYWMGKGISLPDTLVSLVPEWNESRTEGASVQSAPAQPSAQASAAHIVDGGLAVQIVEGFRGEAKALMTRHFSLTPPAQGDIAQPTIIKPSIGTATIKTMGENVSKIDGAFSAGFQAGNTVGVKTQRIGPVLTGNIGVVTVGATGNGSWGTTSIAFFGTFTVSGTPSNGNTVTIGTQVYTFKTALSSGPTVPNEVLIGGSSTNALANLLFAINGLPTVGTNYSVGTVKNSFGMGIGTTSTTLSFMTNVFSDTLSQGVTGFTITNAGSGYATAPTVTISGGGGTGATAVAVTDGSTIVQVNVTNPGVGYTSAPTVAFSGGGGTSAAATAVIGTIDDGQGNYTPPDVTAFAISPDGEVIYPAVFVSAKASASISLNIPQSTPASINSGTTILEDVSVQLWRLGLYITETISILVP